MKWLNKEHSMKQLNKVNNVENSNITLKDYLEKHRLRLQKVGDKFYLNVGDLEKDYILEEVLYTGSNIINIGDGIDLFVKWPQ